MPPDAAPPPSPVRWDDLTGRLRALRAAAGSPSYADLVRRVDAVRADRGVPSHERRPGRVTVYDAFRDGRVRMDVELLTDLVRALGGSDAEADAWRTAHAAVATAVATGDGSGGAAAAGPGAGTGSGAGRAAGPLRAPEPADRLPVLRGRERELAQLLAWAAVADPAPVAPADPVTRVDLAAPAAPVAPVTSRVPDPRGATEAQDDVRPGVVLVTGVPGAGLSALARTVAARHHEATGDVVLVGDGTTDPETVVDALPAGPGLLVLLDVTDPGHVRAVVDAAPTWSLLVTARRSLPVAGARHVALGPLDAEAAVAVLGDLVGPERVAAEPEAAAALAAACGHLPVSLTVAAGQVTERPAWSLADHVHRVRQSAHAVPALDAAYRALDPEQALVLRRLALVGAPLTDTWLAVLAGLDVPAVRQSLAVLEDAHLVHPDDGGRSTVHDLVRRFAREAAQDEEPVSARRSAVERTVARLLEVARPLVAVVTPHHDVTAGSPTGPASPAVARERLDALRPVAVSAGVLCAELGLATPLGELSGLLAAYLDTAGHWSDALVLHGAAAESADPAGRSRAGRDIGRTLEHLGRYDEALSRLVRAHESGHDPRPGQTLNRIGNVYKRLGRTEDALRSYAEAAAAARTGGDAVSEGRAVGNHADALRVLGRHEESFQDYDLALAISERVGDVLNVAVVTSNSALALGHVGRDVEARARVALARSAARRLGDTNLELRTALHEQRLVLAAHASDRRAEVAEAAEVAEEVQGTVPALREIVLRAQTLGEVEAEAEALVVLGQALHRTGDTTGAVRTLTGARDRAGALRARLAEIDALNALGVVLLEAGRTTEARSSFGEALRLARTAGDVGEQVHALTGLGDCAAAEGGTDRAAALWQEALDGAAGARPAARAALRARLAGAPPEG